MFQLAAPPRWFVGVAAQVGDKAEDESVAGRAGGGGFRGRPAGDMEALAHALVRISHLGVNLEGRLSELDINPLMVLPAGRGVKAVDALAVFQA